MKPSTDRPLKSIVSIRKARATEASIIWQLHARAVRQLCRHVYSPAQIEVWATHRDANAYRQLITKHRCFVAESAGRIAGYARYNPESQEFCSIFVDPDFTRQGIGVRLAQTVFADAICNGLSKLWLDASLNAIPFYETMGFKHEQFRVHSFAGVELQCARMTRQLILDEEHAA